MKKHFVWFVPLLFLMAQCEKNNDITHTYAQGTVISFYDSSKVIPNATVYLHRGQDRVLIDSTKSDAQGKFRFDFAPEKNIQYGVTAKEARYFESSKNYFYLNTPYSWASNIKVAAYPKSFIRVRVRDITKNERYDGVRLNHTAYSQFNLAYGYPLTDTTIIVEGYYQTQYFGWGFLYPNKIWGSEKVIPFRTPIPLDTFDLEIKF